MWPIIPVPLADLRPGDIGIDYIPHNQSWTERCIAAGPALGQYHEQNTPW